MKELAQRMREKMFHGEIGRAGFFFSAIRTEFAGHHAAACRAAPILSLAENRRLLSFQTGAAAADKMDNLQLVAILERCTLPLSAGDDFEIQLYRDAVWLHAELRDQTCNSQAVGKVTLFAVNV